MVRFVRLAAAAAAIGLATSMLAGCNDGGLPPASKYSSLSGTVIDHATNKPLAGAIVTVDTVLTATTDASGKFTIAQVPSGIVDYSVQAQGYTVLTSSANADPGKPFELDVSLDPAPPQ
ncbi:MAG: carboxypeptidase-like regulatory domain-containing protein [Vulcanimicrobiaceae bacterium]